MNFMKLNIQLFAHVKAQGSTQNGRDSAGRRLGAKAADGQTINGLRSRGGNRNRERPSERILWRIMLCGKGQT